MEPFYSDLNLSQENQKQEALPLLPGPQEDPIRKGNVTILHLNFVFASLEIALGNN